MPKKRSSKPKSEEPTFPLKLTQHQREAMVHATRLRRKITERLKALPEGTQVVQFTRKELDHMTEEIGTAAVFAPEPYKKRLVAIQTKIDDLLEAASEEPARPKRRRPASESDLILQFKVALLNIKPAIWRRIQVKDGTLADLHELIQAAMGWWNYHLHQFEVEGVRYGPLPEDDFDYGLEMEDESSVRLVDLVPKSGKRTRWVYEYDFGDGWRHEILFEGFPPKQKGQNYPVCLEGERACPPEDVGGPWGYAEYLDAMADPNHERHEEFVDWRGPFDPEAFDPKKATKEMRRTLPR